MTENRKDLDIDELRRWKESTVKKLEIDGKERNITIHHDEPLPEMDIFQDRWEEETKENYKKRRRIEWIKKWSKREYEINDGSEKLKVYFPENPETGERKATFWIDDSRYASFTKSTYIQLRLELDRYFGLYQPISPKDEGELLLKVMKEKYGIDLIMMLVEKDTITVQEFANKININEQDTRKHLNKFERMGLFKTHRYKAGAVKIYKSALGKKKLREIAEIFE